MENFKIGSVLHKDIHSTIYEAFDRRKDCWCFLTIPNVDTSWNYSVDY